MNLIDKTTVIAEIDRRQRMLDLDNPLGRGGMVELQLLKDKIDTFEVKEEFKIGETEIYLEDDGGEPPYDGKQWLDLTCTEYEIPEDKFKDGDNVEIIISKTKRTIDKSNNT